MKEKVTYLSGLSLLEIMISICLLSLILISLITVFPSSIESIKFSKNIAIASNIANKHIDLYKSNFYLLPDIINVELYSSNHSSIDYPVEMEETTFTPAVMVKRVMVGTDMADPNQVEEVIVSVYWKQSSGIKKVRVASYIYNKYYLPGNVPIY